VGFAATNLANIGNLQDWAGEKEKKSAGYSWGEESVQTSKGRGPVLPPCFLVDFSSFFCYHAFLSMEKHGYSRSCDTPYPPGAYRGWGSRPSGSQNASFSLLCHPAPSDPKRRPSLWKRLPNLIIARVCEERWRGQGAGRLPPRNPPERRKPAVLHPVVPQRGVEGRHRRLFLQGIGGGKKALALLPASFLLAVPLPLGDPCPLSAQVGSEGRGLREIGEGPIR
jgi:hypothetical protein